VRIRRLEQADKRAEFASGNDHLDEFFRRFARQHQDRHLSATYVADDDGLIRGFATIVSAELAPTMISEQVRKRWPRGSVPVLRLARMAVAKHSQGKGVGKQLLAHVFALAHQQAERSGCLGVVVDAKPDAVSFYKLYGFEELVVVEGRLAGAGGEAAPAPMYLEIGAIPRE
jgi:GNAT superfamily N-acetyltransferase